MTLIMPCGIEFRKPISKKPYKDFLKECSDYSNSPLIWAIVANEPFEKIKQMIEEGADLDEKDNYGMTPLMIACKYNLTEVVNYLIAIKVDVNEKDNSFSLLNLQKYRILQAMAFY